MKYLTDCRKKHCSYEKKIERNKYPKSVIIFKITVMNYCQPGDFFCQEPRLSVVLGIAVDDYWLKNSYWESLFQIITEIMTTYKSNLVSIMQAEI